jgi:hypothetical protein
VTLDEVVLSALRSGDMTVTEVHTFLGSAPRSTIGDAIERLHGAGQVYIVRWHRRNTPVYRPGNLKDVGKPRPRTPAQRTRKYREEHAAEVRIRRAAREGSKLQHYIQLLQC